MPFWSPTPQLSSSSTRRYAKTQNTVNGKLAASMTLLTKVASGDYPVCHETVTLYLAANTRLSAECSMRPTYKFTPVVSKQVQPNRLFSGAWGDNDCASTVRAHSPGAPYTFPGGPVSNLASPADTTGQLSENDSSSSSGGGELVPMSTTKMASWHPRMELRSTWPFDFLFSLQYRRPRTAYREGLSNRL